MMEYIKRSDLLESKIEQSVFEFIEYRVNQQKSTVKRIIQFRKIIGKNVISEWIWNSWKRIGWCKILLVFDRRAAISLIRQPGQCKGIRFLIWWRDCRWQPRRKIKSINSKMPARQTAECNSKQKLNCAPCLKKGQSKSKQQPSNSNTISRVQFQSTAQKYVKKFQGFVK